MKLITYRVYSFLREHSEECKFFDGFGMLIQLILGCICLSTLLRTSWEYKSGIYTKGEDETFEIEKHHIDFRLFYIQVICWIVIVLISKISSTAILLLLSGYIEQLGKILLYPLKSNPKLKLVLVMIIFPLIFTSLQFWITDNIIQSDKIHENFSEIYKNKEKQVSEEETENLIINQEKNENYIETNFQNTSASDKKTTNNNTLAIAVSNSTHNNSNTVNSHSFNYCIMCREKMKDTALKNNPNESNNSLLEGKNLIQISDVYCEYHEDEKKKNKSIYFQIDLDTIENSAYIYNENHQKLNENDECIRNIKTSNDININKNNGASNII